MRKKTIKCGIDTIFWYIIYLLPIILTVVQSIGLFKGVSFDDWLSSASIPLSDYNFMRLFDNNMSAIGFGGYGILEDIVILLEEVLSVDGVYGFPLGKYFLYLIYCNIMHLFIDFILFIPRLCHKWMNAFTRTED